MFVLKLVIQPLHNCHGNVQTSSVNTSNNWQHPEFEFYPTAMLFEYLVISTVKTEPRGKPQSPKIHWHTISMNNFGSHVINQKLGLLLKLGLRPWTWTLDSDPEKPGTWKNWTQKNLDTEKPGHWKTWTLKNLNTEKPRPWKTWNNYRIKKYVLF